MNEQDYEEEKGWKHQHLQYEQGGGAVKDDEKEEQTKIQEYGNW